MKPAPDHEREREVVGQRSHGEQIADVGDVVADRHDRGARPEVAGHVRSVGGRHGQHDGVEADQAVGFDLANLAGERGGGPFGPMGLTIGDQQLLDLGRGQPLPQGPHADGAGPEHAEAHQPELRTGSSCQPPPCGGTPPWPRTRKAAATAPATRRAATARRKTFTS